MLLTVRLSPMRLQQILNGLVHDLEGSHIHRLDLCWQPPLLNVQEQTLNHYCTQPCNACIRRLSAAILAASRASADPMQSDKSVIYTPGQQFLLAPRKGPDRNKSLQSIQSLGSDAYLLKASQSLGSDGHTVDKDAQDEFLLGASAPTTENLAQLQEHQSAAEEFQAQDLIRAQHAAAPRSAFWGEDSRSVVPATHSYHLLHCLLYLKYNAIRHFMLSPHRA